LAVTMTPTKQESMVIHGAKAIWAICQHYMSTTKVKLPTPFWPRVSSSFRMSRAEQSWFIKAGTIMQTTPNPWAAVASVSPVAAYLDQRVPSAKQEFATHELAACLR